MDKTRLVKADDSMNSIKQQSKDIVTYKSVLTDLKNKVDQLNADFSSYNSNNHTVYQHMKQIDKLDVYVNDLLAILEDFSYTTSELDNL